jgi:hypothetical protein
VPGQEVAPAELVLSLKAAAHDGPLARLQAESQSDHCPGKAQYWVPARRSVWAMSRELVPHGRMAGEQIPREARHPRRPEGCLPAEPKMAAATPEAEPMMGRPLLAATPLLHQEAGKAAAERAGSEQARARSARPAEVRSARQAEVPLEEILAGLVFLLLQGAASAPEVGREVRRSAESRI